MSMTMSTSQTCCRGGPARSREMPPDELAVNLRGQSTNQGPAFCEIKNLTESSPLK